MTVQNGQWRDGGKEDAAGLWKGWWRDGGWADAAGQCHGGVA